MNLFQSKPKKRSEKKLRSNKVISETKPLNSIFKSGFSGRNKLKRQKNEIGQTKIQKASSFVTSSSHKEINKLKDNSETSNKFRFGPLRNLHSFKGYFGKLKSTSESIDKTKLLKLITIKICQSIGVCLMTTILYLSFFDTQYTIKNWNINLTKGSYLDSQQTNKIINSYQNNRLLGIFPSNIYWFLTETNLTYLAFESEPTVKKVQITNRYLPNKAALQITTQPILATISIKIGNRNEYWRISKSGQIVSQDEANSYEKSIVVDKSISYDKIQGDFHEANIFETYPAMLDRIYFSLFVQDLLNQYPNKVAAINFSSLNVADGEVTMTLQNKTRLIFDATKFDKDSLRIRVEAVFNGKLVSRIDNGELSYIDLRIPRRVFICSFSQKCTNNYQR